MKINMGVFFGGSSVEHEVAIICAVEKFEGSGNWAAEPPWELKPEELARVVSGLITAFEPLLVGVSGVGVTAFSKSPFPM